MVFLKIKSFLVRYITENFNDLLCLDLKAARVLGAPSPHTLSSYAYRLELEGKPAGRLFRPAIDFLAFHILDQTNHCQVDYERVEHGTNGQFTGKNQETKQA